MTRSYGQFCGLARALDHIGDRWTLLIVRELLIGPCRYSDLHAALSGVATNLLAQRLRGLEADGLVSRRLLPAPAATAVYELTPLGASLRESVEALTRWGGWWVSEGRGQDYFQPRWLVLALRALIRPPATAAGGGGDDADGKVNVVDIVVEDLRIRVIATTGEPPLVALAGDSPPPTAVAARLGGDAETVLALFAGMRSLGQAISTGGLDVSGDRGVVRSVLSRFGMARQHQIEEAHA